MTIQRCPGDTKGFPAVWDRVSGITIARACSPCCGPEDGGSGGVPRRPGCRRRVRRVPGSWHGGRIATSACRRRSLLSVARKVQHLPWDHLSPRSTVSTQSGLLQRHLSTLHTRAGAATVTPAAAEPFLSMKRMTGENRHEMPPLQHQQSLRSPLRPRS